jgi:hypothetical protein
VPPRALARFIRVWRVTTSATPRGARRTGVAGAALCPGRISRAASCRAAAPDLSPAGAASSHPRIAATNARGAPPGNLPHGLLSGFGNPGSAPDSRGGGETRRRFSGAPLRWAMGDGRRAMGDWRQRAMRTARLPAHGHHDPHGHDTSLGGRRAPCPAHCVKGQRGP